MKNSRDIIKRPVITEHTADLMADKKYTFEVSKNANKTEIKAAVEEIFGVKVVKVNTANIKGSLSEWVVTVVIDLIARKLLCNCQKTVKNLISLKALIKL